MAWPVSAKKKKEARLSAVWKTAVCLTLLLALTFLPLPLLQQCFPAAYGDSYNAALGDKYTALQTLNKETDGGRILVIGGSATAFSVDGALLSEECGLPCLNFGLYAAFGTPYMMELARDSIREGDIVLLCPELSSQTCSMYFGAEAVLRGSEGNLSLLFAVRLSDLPSLITAYPSFFVKKLAYLDEGGGGSGVYARSSFDEMGNMVFVRDKNRMEYGYLPDALPEIDPEIYDEAFLSYLNEYAADARKKGATVYYTFPFLCDLSVQQVSQRQMEKLEKFLTEKLDFPLLCSLSSRILAAGYFYDSNYHTNSAGMTVATLRLAADLKRELGDMTALKQTEPPMPETDFSVEDGETFTDGVYLYRKNSDGVTLQGVTEEGRAMETLDVPSELGGYTLTAVGSGAFQNCLASEIFLPSTVQSLGGRLFEGCSNLQTLYLRSDRLPSVGDTLLNGLEQKIRILVKESLYGDYATDYFWLYYSDCLKAEG